MAAVDAFKVRAIIEAGYDKTSLNRANRDIEASFSKLNSKLAGMTAASRAVQQAALGTGAAFIASFAGGVAAAAAFEEQFVNVKKTLDVKGTADEAERAFANISKRLRELVKTAPVTTEQINQIAAIGGQLGISANQLVSFTDTIQKLTVATNLSAEDAALSMARLQEITGTSSLELDNLGASLVALGNNFAAQESEIVTAALQIATSTAQISGEMNNAAVDALAFSTALKAIGQPSQAGATAIVRLMSELSEAVALGGSNLSLFARTAGLSVEAFKDLYDVDSTKAVALFIKGLNDTSELGETNIAVLQKLGLGQVRTQKAILALAKANDTLFDAIDTANAGFIENNALNEEAERRYATLFSEIQKGKNIISGEIIDFGLENLEDGTDAVRKLSNALLTVVKGFRAIVSGGMQSAFAIGGILGMWRAVTAQQQVALAGLNAYATFAARTQAMMKNENMAADGVFFGGAGTISKDYTEEEAAMFYRRGIVGGGIHGNIRNRITPSVFQQQSKAMLARQVLSEAPLLQMAYSGNVPAALSDGLGLYNQFGSDYLSGVPMGGDKVSIARMQLLQRMGQGTGRFGGMAIERRSGRVAARMRLAAERQLLKRNQESLLMNQRLGEQEFAVGPVRPGEGRVRTAQSTSLKVLDENIAKRDKLKQLGKEIGMFGRTELKIRSDVLEKAGEEFNITRKSRLIGRESLQSYTRRLRMSEGFNKQLKLSQKALEEGDIAGGSLALHMEKTEMSAGKFRNAISGAAKAIGKMVAMMAVFQLVFKVLEKFGEESRGIQDFSMNMRDAAESMTELAENTTKLANARRLLDTYSNDEEIEKIITTNIENLEKQIAAQRKKTSVDIGKSFLEDIMIGSFGRAEGGLLSGTEIEGFIRKQSLLSGEAEEAIKERFGEQIGNIVMDLTDPEANKARFGQLPTVNDLIEATLFREEDGVQIPSRFFEGTSAQIFEELQKAAGSEKGIDLIDFLGVRPEDIGVTGFGEIFDQTIGQAADKLYGGADSVDFGGPMKDLFNIVDEYSDADRREVIQFVYDYMSALSTIGGLTGTDMADINIFSEMSENSPLASNIKKFLKERLEDFKAAGLVTQKELNRAGNNYTLLYNLYSRAYKQFADDVSEANKNIESELGISELAALRIANKITETFKSARKSLVDLFSKVPENEFEDFNLVQILIDNTKKAQQQQEFERLVRGFAAKGQGVLANELTELGIMGGGLQLARQYSQNPAFAAATELSLRKVGGSSFVEELLGSDSVGEEEQIKALGYPLGDDLSKGLSQAFEDNKEVIAQSLISAMDYAVVEFKKKYEIDSPSKAMMDLGEDLMGGLYLGIDNGRMEVRSVFADTLDEVFDLDIAGEAFGKSITMEKFGKLLMDTGKFVNETQATRAVANFAGADTQQFMNDLAKTIANAMQQVVSKTQQAMSLITNITNLQRQQISNELALGREKMNYINFLESQQLLELQLEDIQERRIKAERDGIAGNITMQEKADLLRQKINIDDRKRRLAGDFTASEQLGIQEQERKVREFQRMFSLGVIGGLELEAEQDRLRDMKGEFKSQDEKELFFLESAIAEENYLQARKDAEAFDQNIVTLRAQERDLIYQINNATDLATEAYGRVEAAQERVVVDQINLTAAYEEFKLKAPGLVDEINIIEDAFGKVNTPVGILLDSIDDLGNIDTEALMTKLTPLIEAAAEIQAAEDLADTIYSSTATDAAAGFRSQYMERVGTAGLENQNIQDILLNPNYGLLYNTGLGNLISRASGNYEVTDAKANEGRGAAMQLFEMLEDVLGASSVARDQETGQYFFDIGSVGTDVANQLMDFGFGARTAADIRTINTRNKDYQAGLRSMTTAEDPNRDDLEGTQRPTKKSDVINWNGDPRTLKPGFKYLTNYGVMTKGRIMSMINSGIPVDRPSAAQIGGPAPTAMMGMRVKGMKYGGRADGAMRRALVGEYGPEEVRFVPGSGFLVKPLTQGGRGNNTIVENLSVNVTGVPSDPIQARKAAQEIQKALVRLDREGKAGGGLTRR